MSRLMSAFAIFLCSSTPIRANAYDGSPKLAIVLAFDQFRGDYLERYPADFHSKNGWNPFLQHSAHFTDCNTERSQLPIGLRDMDTPQRLRLIGDA